MVRGSVGGVTALNGEGEGALDPTAESDNDPLDDPNHPLNLFDDNGNGHAVDGESESGRPLRGVEVSGAT